LVPDVEPDTYPVVAFNHPTKDVTDLPFGQNVALVPNHTTGDHEFEARLEGENGQIGIEMAREKLDGSTGWVPFIATPPSTPAQADDDKAYLYGAWQAAEGEDGATNLHLFARSPFEYAEPAHIDYKRAIAGYRELMEDGSTAY